MSSAMSTVLLTVGLIGGANVSTFVGSEAALVDQAGSTTLNPGFITAYVAGASMELEHRRMYGLRTELLFSVRGGKYEGQLDDYVSAYLRYGYGLRSIPANSANDMRHGWFQLMMALQF